MKILFNHFILVLFLTISLKTTAQISTNRSFPPINGNKDDKKWYAHPDSTDFNFSISPDYFLLGTLNGYMGRKYSNPEENTIDSYKAATHLKRYIFDFIKNHYYTSPDSTDAYFIKDDKVAKKINSYFDQDGKITLQDLKDENELYSYILGKYLVYGEHLDEKIYKIIIVNSFEGDLVYKSLKQIGCDKILYKIYRGYIPTSQVYYFEATPRMIKFFKSFANLKDKISHESILSYLEIRSISTLNEIKRMRNESKNKEFNRIKAAFSDDR